MTDHFNGTRYSRLGVDDDDELGFPVSARFLPLTKESISSGMQVEDADFTTVLDLASDSDTDCEWDK